MSCLRSLQNRAPGFFVLPAILLLSAIGFIALPGSVRASAYRAGGETAHPAPARAVGEIGPESGAPWVISWSRPDVIPVDAPFDQAQPDIQDPSPDEPKGGRRRTGPHRDRRPPDRRNIRYGDADRHVLDLWLTTSHEPAPLVVYFHGGGFRGGDKSSLSPAILQGCLERGMTVAAANYRLSGEAPFPAPMHDAARAIQFLRLHADEYNIDPTRVAAFGGSAGAGISLWLAFHDDLAHTTPIVPVPAGDDPADDPLVRESTRLICAASIAGQCSYDPRFIREHFDAEALDHPAMLPFYGLARDETETDEAHALYEEASPITHLTADDPPVFMYYPQPDTPVGPDRPRQEWVHHPKFGYLLKAELDELGIPCVLRVRDDTPRDGDDLEGGASVRAARADPLAEMVEFFAEYLLPSPDDAEQRPIPGRR